MAHEVQLTPGWLKRDVQKASERREIWSTGGRKTSTSYISTTHSDGSREVVVESKETRHTDRRS